MPKQKRRFTGANANKDVLAVYHKLVEVVENLALLVEAQPLTDTIVLQVLWLWNTYIETELCK